MTSVAILGVEHIPEVQPGDDLVQLIQAGLAASKLELVRGDLLVVTHKVMSKSENRLVDLRNIEPSPFARSFAERWGKDARQTEVVLRESARVVRMDRGVVISETHHGFVCANAGVDASNVPGADIVCLLPVDPDQSAQQVHQGISKAVGFDVPIVVSDSWGRPWREGIVNVAIGVAGLAPLADYRGQTDAYGLKLQASVLAVADELAAAAELVMGKLDAIPVAVVRGYAWQAASSTGRELLMDPRRDMFR